MTCAHIRKPLNGYIFTILNYHNEPKVWYLEEYIRLTYISEVTLKST